MHGAAAQFQSAPGPGAGRYSGRTKLTPQETAFQSAPGPGAGRYRMMRTLQVLCSRFNPLPARGPGDTLEAMTKQITDLQVSIRSRPGGREIPYDAHTTSAVRSFQSAPGPGAGRY